MKHVKTLLHPEAQTSPFNPNDIAIIYDHYLSKGSEIKDLLLTELNINGGSIEEQLRSKTPMIAVDVPKNITSGEWACVIYDYRCLNRYNIITRARSLLIIVNTAGYGGPSTDSETVNFIRYEEEGGKFHHL